MAKHGNKSESQEMWFGKKYFEKVKSYPKDRVEKTLFQQNQSKAKDQLLTERTQNQIKQLEKNHLGFFKDPFDFEIYIPTNHLTTEALISDSNYPITVTISSTGIHTQIKAELKKQGVVIGDVSQIREKKPDIISRFKKSGHPVRNSAISSLIHAATDNALFVYIPKEMAIEGTILIKLDCEVENAVIPLHLVTKIEQSATANISLQIISNDKSAGKKVIVLQTDFLVGEDSQLSIFRHQTADDKTLVFVDDEISQARSSRVEYFNFDEGAKGLSSKIALLLNGEGTHASITGIYRPRQESRYFYDTEQIHSASYSESDLLYDGVIGEEAYASWQGNIIVESGTKGANGYQANNNMIIHSSGKVESVPGLEIITDDVKCSHGVTIGNIDKNHMFYLQSRGINKDEAEKLIINGFLESSLIRIKSKEIKKQISAIFDI